MSGGRTRRENGTLRTVKTPKKQQNRDKGSDLQLPRLKVFGGGGMENSVCNHQEQGGEESIARKTIGVHGVAVLKLPVGSPEPQKIPRDVKKRAAFLTSHSPRAFPAK